MLVDPQSPRALWLVESVKAVMPGMMEESVQQRFWSRTKLSTDQLLTSYDYLPSPRMRRTLSWPN